MSNFPVMPDALRHDYQNLTALVADYAERQTVPCFNGTETPREWWTSDRLSQRNTAAKACGPCPVLTQCRQWGIDHPQEVGALGGLVETDRERAAKEQTKERANR